MDNFQPTHFIEQYNVKDSSKPYVSKHYYFSAIPHPLAALDYWLKDTASISSLHTVAIFKIMYKKKDQ